MTQAQAKHLGWTIVTQDGGRILAVAPEKSDKPNVSALTIKTVLKRIAQLYA